MGSMGNNAIRGSKGINSRGSRAAGTARLTGVARATLEGPSGAEGAVRTLGDTWAAGRVGPSRPSRPSEAAGAAEAAAGFVTAYL